MVVLVNGGFDVEAMELLAELAYAVASGDAAAIVRERARADSVIATFPERVERIRATARVAPPAAAVAAAAGDVRGTYRSPALGELRIVRWGDGLRLVLGQVHSAVEGYDVAKQQVRLRSAPAPEWWGRSSFRRTAVAFEAGGPVRAGGQSSRGAITRRWGPGALRRPGTLSTIGATARSVPA